MKALKLISIVSFLAFTLTANAQRRNGIQDYLSVSALQAETLTPLQNDKVFIKPTRFLYTWDSGSTATHDGVNVIKQTNISTGRFLLATTDLSTKANIASPTFTGTVSGITAGMVGLPLVNNTSDASKPVSTAQQTALDLKANIASPTFTGVPRAPTAAAGTNTTQLATTAFVTIADNLKANIASPTFTGTVSGITADMVGLPLVNNTSDASKPVSTAQQTALDLKANIASPTFTGVPLAPTAAAGTNTTQLATTAFVTTADNLKANIASPTFTGVPLAPTAAAGTNTTQLATTAFVTIADNLRILSVDNIATLKTITGVAGQIISTKGYYIDGDGGGNTYYWNTTSTATENFGTIIRATATSTGRWLTKNESTEVTAKSFGAKADGTTDDTIPLSNALQFCITNSKVLIVNEGEYRITNTIHNTSNYTGSENLYIRISGNVKFTVPTGNPDINTAIIVFGHNATTNVNISGGSLIVNLNNKCRGFLEVRNNGLVSSVFYVTTGGEFKISLNSLIISNVFAGSSSDGDASGILSLGSFERVDISNVTVTDVTRHDVVGGECKGIAIQSTRGFVSVNNCKLSRVLAPATNQADADGLAIFGMQEDPGVTNSHREGKAVITNCIFIDNQGRSIKIQLSDATVNNCRFERRNVICTPNTHDIDFQFGNGIANNNTFIYRKNGATSPLQWTFIPVIFQNVLSNREQNSTAKDNVFYTEIPIRSPFFAATFSGAKNATLDIKSNEVVSILTLAGLASIDRGFLEFIGGDVFSMSGKMTINLSENTAFSGNVPFLSYSSVTTVDMSDKLVFRCVGNYNENTAVNPRVFAPISGSTITNVNKFQILGNAGYSCNMTPTFVVNLSANRILPNTEIQIDLSTNSVTSGPSGMTTAGYANVKVSGQWDNGALISEIFCEASSGSHFLYKSTGLGWKKVAMVNN